VDIKTFLTSNQALCEYLELSETATLIRFLAFYEGWNFNSGSYLFTTDTK